MSNWIEDAVVESIKDRIHIKESFIHLCEFKKQEFQDKFNTDDKFEAANHEYWRTSELMARGEIKYLQELLQEITDMELEEIVEYEELYKQQIDIPCENI